MRVRIGLFACLLPLTPAFAQSAEQGARRHAQSASITSKKRVKPDEFFAHPEALCKALNPAGIETGEWKQIGMGPHPSAVPYMCEYDGAPVNNNSAASRDITTLFRVSGDTTGLRADVISIAVSIKAPIARTAGQKEIEQLVGALFQWIGQPEPAGLLRAMARRRYYLSRRPYGVVWFNFVNPDHPGYQRVFWFRLSKSAPG